MGYQSLLQNHFQTPSPKVNRGFAVGGSDSRQNFCNGIDDLIERFRGPGSQKRGGGGTSSSPQPMSRLMEELKECYGGETNWKWFWRRNPSEPFSATLCSRMELSGQSDKAWKLYGLWNVTSGA
ncbi:hypothetical protein TNIN_210421 [Trichonephila inaurata madagascariensis]|uniref:Uncharacterized protein n=1 Tax=Trichonephila inaurata madagascariensis TaxID=2747483 RepID=A0A8X6YMI6_9ARAC|nr:hypothetical protein TNIN_210421 [Trichonephila inaurata madagascariensis]